MLWQITNTLFGFAVPWITTEHADGSLGGFDQIHANFNGGGFACGIGAEHSEEFAGVHREAQVIHGGEVAELFYEIFQFDHGLRRRATP